MEITTNIWEFVLTIIGYIYGAFCLQTIAQKTNTENAWCAWVPFANLYLMCRIAGRPGWWILLFFVPLVNIVILTILWMEIAKALGKPGWFGLLIILFPIIASITVTLFIVISFGINFEIPEDLKVPFWLNGIVILFSLAPAILTGYLAFSETDSSKTDVDVDKKGTKIKIRFPFEAAIPIVVLGAVFYFILSVEPPSEDKIISQAGISIEELKRIDSKLEALKDPFFQSLKSTLPDEFTIIPEKVGRSNPFEPVK